MAGNIFSTNFFKQIAMAKSDVNKSGGIDDSVYNSDGTSINEKSIFDEEFKKFDMNKDGVVDDNDIPLFKRSIGATPEDEQRSAKYAEFKKQHPDFDDRLDKLTRKKERYVVRYEDRKNERMVVEFNEEGFNTSLTPEDKETLELIEEFKNCYNSSDLDKRIANLKFDKDVRNTASYLLDTEQNNILDDYWHSISKKLGILNGLDENEYSHIESDMFKLSVQVTKLKDNQTNNESTLELANNLTTKIINTADKAQGSFRTQKYALTSLQHLAEMGVDTKELIEDIKNNLRMIKANDEHELQTVQDDEEYIGLVQDEIDRIDKLLE